MNEELWDRAKVYLKELVAHRWLIVLAYTVVNIAVLSVGVNWPRVFESRATIIVESNKVITPLMEGAAVPTDVDEYVRMADELIYSRKLMTMAMEAYVGVGVQLSVFEQQWLIDRLQRRTDVESHSNLIEVIFKDSNPEKARTTAQLLAEAYIAESAQLKLREGDSAFSFIENQIREYRGKVDSADAALLSWRNENLAILSQLDAPAGEDLGRIESMVEETQNALREAELTVESLEMQLANASGFLELEDPYFHRLARLQQQLNVLQISYHDTYPDIVRLKREIEDVKEILRQNSDSSIGSARPIERSALINPVERELKLKLYNLQSEIVLLQNKRERLLSKREDAAARNDILNVARAELEPLERELEINTSIYQALLKKKEQARLSLELDLQRQGEGLRVYEPAFLPSQPKGIGFFHFVVISQILGIGVPLGLLLVRLIIDGRIRSEGEIAEQLNLPVMGSIPYVRTGFEQVRHGIGTLAVLTLVTFNVLMIVNTELTMSVSDRVFALLGTEDPVQWVESRYSLL